MDTWKMKLGISDFCDMVFKSAEQLLCSCADLRMPRIADKLHQKFN